MNLQPAYRIRPIRPAGQAFDWNTAPTIEYGGTPTNARPDIPTSTPTPTPTPISALDQTGKTPVNYGAYGNPNVVSSLSTKTTTSRTTTYLVIGVVALAGVGIFLATRSRV